MRAGYEELLGKLLDRSQGETLDEAVEVNYDQCDVQFLTLLNQKVNNAVNIKGVGGDAGARVCEGRAIHCDPTLDIHIHSITIH